MFTVAGGRVHLMHRGVGAPPMIVLPGAGTVGLDYYQIFADAAELGTAVLYDRRGTGWSDEIALPRTPSEVVDELRLVLRAAGLEPPFLLIGHSLGGGYAQLYARRFPEEVAALLLLDPAHEDYPKYEPPSERTEGEQTFDMAAWEPPPEVLRIFAALFAEKFARYPDEVRDAVIGYHTTHWRAGILEASNLTAIYDDLRRPPPLGDIPLIVLTALAIDPGTRLFMPDEQQRLVIEGKRRLNAAIAASVPRGENRELADACHSFMMAERADAVSSALGDLLAMVRTGSAG
jgi:pimeloyl-ACP methyl ester carboxylesterase